MPRTSVVHYIAPSAISITPNANSSANDLAVSIAKGTKIKVYSPKAGLDMMDATFQEWTISGRNRRLNDPEQNGTEYTIYARLPKNDKTGGYLVFAPKDKRDGGVWADKYCYVTLDGLTKHGNTGTDSRVLDHVNWWIRLGDISLPVDGKRTVTLDTGILGTDQYNTEWNMDPDDMPLRVQLGCTVDGDDAGPTPYVPWGKSMVMQAKLVEGWGSATYVERFHHWSISRNTGDAVADASWPDEERAASFGTSGNITISHARGDSDDFRGAVSTIFTVVAYGLPDENGDAGNPEDAGGAGDSGSQDGTGDGGGEEEEVQYVPIAVGTITVMAETEERYELELSTAIVSYDPTTDTYSPSEGVKVRVRATDQRSSVFKLTKGQLDATDLVVQYALAETESWTDLAFSDAGADPTEGIILTSVFHAQQNVNVRICKPAGDSPSPEDEEQEPAGDTAEQQLVEIYRTPIAFVRNGEDSREREWIFLRSQAAIAFSDDSQAAHPKPALIEYGEVEPGSHAAGHVTNEKNQDGWVPEGWWDEQQGVDETNRYEYSSHRDWVRESNSSEDNPESGERVGHWGDFSKPTIWNYHGEDATTYRCRWTLNGVEVYQLKASYTGAFHGTLPLVATLMKRVGSAKEEAVTATQSVVIVSFVGIPSAGGTFSVTNPQFVISTSEHPEFIPYLSNVDLSSISIKFAVGGEEFSYSIHVVREADEEAVKSTIEEEGSKLFLSKKHPDTAEDVIAFLKGLKFGTLESQYGVNGEGVGTFLELISNFLHTAGFIKESGLAGLGFGVTTEANGWATTQTDDLIVLGRMFVNSLNIREVSYIGGIYLLTPAGSTVEKVQNLYTTGSEDDTSSWTTEGSGNVVGYRLLWKADDGTTSTMNYWKQGDQAFCEIFNINKAGTYDNFHNRRYWRLVCRVGHTTIDGKEYNYADLSDTATVYLYDNKGDEIHNVAGGTAFLGYEGAKDGVNKNSVPDVDDKVVCLGSQADTRRQAAIELSAEGTGSFGIYDNINDYKPLATYEIHFMSKDAVRMRASRFSLTTSNNISQPATVYCGDWTENQISEWGYEWTYRGQNWLCIMPRTAVDPNSQNVLPGQTLEAPGTTAAWWTSNTAHRDRTYSEWVRGTTYYYKTLNPEVDAETGRSYVETSYVWHRGILWMCLVTGTTQEPEWACTDWQAVGGDQAITCEILSSAGSAFHGGNVDTILTMSVTYGQMEIGPKLAYPTKTITWKRMTGWDNTLKTFVETAADRSWSPTYNNEGRLSIVLVRSDMGSGWMTDYRRAQFVCIIDEDGPEPMMAARRIL